MWWWSAFGSALSVPAPLSLSLSLSLFVLEVVEVSFLGGRGGKGGGFSPFYLQKVCRKASLPIFSFLKRYVCVGGVDEEGCKSC